MAPFRRYRPDGAGIVTVDTEELDWVELRVNALSGALRVLKRYFAADRKSDSSIDGESFPGNLGSDSSGRDDLVFRTSQGRRTVRFTNVSAQKADPASTDICIDQPGG